MRDAFAFLRGRPRQRSQSVSARSLAGLDWFVFFMGDIQTGFGPFVAVYLVTQKWSQTDIGFVLSLGALASLVCQIPGGALVDAMRSERRAAAAAVALIGISAALIAAWPIFVAVALARVLQAGASAVVGPAVGAITLGLVGRDGVAERLGRNTAFAAAGNGIAALVMGACGHFISPRAVFFVTAAFAVPTLLALFRIRADEINAERAHGAALPAEDRPGAGGLATLLRKRALWVFLAGVAFFQLANAAMLPLMAATYTARAPNWAVTLVAACIVVPQLVAAALSPWVGSLAETLGRRPLLTAGLCTLPLRGLLFAFSAQPAALVAVQMLDGISAAAFGVLMPLILADVAYGTGRFNLAQGITGATIGLAAAASTAGAGCVSDCFGPGTAFLCLAGIGALGALAVALFMPETAPRTPEGPRSQPSRQLDAKPRPA